MKRQWTNEELISHFTLLPKELDLIGESKSDHNLLGFAMLLKYFQYEGCFPSQKQDIPSIVMVYLAQQFGCHPRKDHTLQLGWAHDQSTPRRYPYLFGGPRGDAL